MIEIARCESGQRQMYDNGDVVISRTRDYGVFQLSYQWIPLAKKMGLDIVHNEKDNISFALWLYHKEGTRPWNSSKACWGAVADT